MNEDRSKWMQNVIKNQFDFLKHSFMTSCNLEIFLRFCHQLSPYSVRNVLLIMAQSNGKARECHGADEWCKKHGAMVLNGATPYSIFAPMEHKKKTFTIAWVYDISDTSCNQLSMKEIPNFNEHLNLLNLVAKKMGLKLVFSNFSNELINKGVIRKNNIIYMNKKHSIRINTILVLRELCLEKINILIRNKKRAISYDNLNKAIACCSAFEISDWLNENPPRINSKAKQIILTNGLFEANIRDINNIAFQVIKDIKKIIDISKENQLETSRV